MVDGVAAVAVPEIVHLDFLNVIRGELRDGKSHHFWLGRSRGNH